VFLPPDPPVFRGLAARASGLHEPGTCACAENEIFGELEMSITIFGIKNCDTMKKARTWLENAGILHAFHDYKVSAIDEKSLRRFCAALTWDKVLNRSGTTFRKLPEAEKADINEAKAIALMLALPSMIKRPILEGRVAGRDVLLVGFDPTKWNEALHG
jgi:arsenate reductase (glutaredoxin)